MRGLQGKQAAWVENNMKVFRAPAARAFNNVTELLHSVTAKNCSCCQEDDVEGRQNACTCFTFSPRVITLEDLDALSSEAAASSLLRDSMRAEAASSCSCKVTAAPLRPLLSHLNLAVDVGHHGRTQLFGRGGSGRSGG